MIGGSIGNAAKTSAKGLYRLELVFDYLPPMNTTATRGHPMKLHKQAKLVREVVVAVVGNRRPPEPLTRARIICTRHSGSKRPDPENLAMSFKAWIDALTKSQMRRNKKAPGGYTFIQRADVLEDDAPEVLKREYRWFPARPKKGFIRIVVEEIEEPAAPSEDASGGGEAT
jgi:hypothetical protein